MTYRELEEVWRFAECTYIFAAREEDREAAWQWLQDHKVQLIQQVDDSILHITLPIGMPREAKP